MDKAKGVGPDDPFSGTGMANWAGDTMHALWLGEEVSIAGVGGDGTPDETDLGGDGTPDKADLG